MQPPVEPMDFVDLEWHECERPLRAVTASGEPVRMLLGGGKRLRHGDVIHDEPHRVVVVRIRPCELIVCEPQSPADAAILALELGNLHLPVQIVGAKFMFVEDDRAVEVLEALRIPWTRKVRRFEPTLLMSTPTARRVERLQIITSSPGASAFPVTLSS